MLIIDRPHTDPYFNLAAEEYLLKNAKEDCFMLWINEPSVVIGKHQNAFAEINSEFVASHNIPVVRRITGGGTVFHDPGNLNFSFIHQGKRGGLVDFRKFTDPIIDYLNTLGIPARFEGKNDIRVKGLKVSGNAEHVYKDRVLHHGTLLFSSKLGRLNKAIKGNEELYHDKAVKSVRSTVANISGFLDQAMVVEEFKNGILEFIHSKYGPVKVTSLEPHAIKAIEGLVETKYKTWEWNFAYSPAFVFEKVVFFCGEESRLKITVREGLVQSAGSEENELLSLSLQWMRGLRYRKDDLTTSLNKMNFREPSAREDIEKIVNSLF